jgi:hypothetical protein
MKEPFSDEILSAYLDGELPPQESAAVERWLESNSAARAKLEDFRRLSGLFDGLPRTELPREFPTKVLQLSERRMLLPESGTAAARRRLHMRLLAVAASIGSAAALLFVAVHLLGPGQPPQPFAGPNQFAPGLIPKGRDSVGGGSDAGRRGAANSGDRLIAQDDRSIVAGRTAELSAPATFVDQPAASNRRPGGADGAKSDGKSLDATTRGEDQAGAILAKSSSRMASAAGAQGAAPIADPQLAAINESLGQLRDSGADEKLTSVVRLHVIDHADGLELLQNIFSENNVVLSDEANGGVEKLPDREQQKRRQTAGKKEALYVVARPEQVMAAFTAIIERDSQAVLTVEEPIQIASFDPGSRKQLEDLLRGLNRASLTTDDSAPPSPGDRSAEAGKAKSPTEKPPAPVEGDKTPSKPEARSTPPAPGPSAAPEKKKMFSLRKQTSAAQQPLAKDSDKAEPADGAEVQDAAARRDGNKVAGTPGRQLVVPVPRELESRHSRSGTAAPPAPARATRNAVALPADAGKGGAPPAREEKAKAEAEQAPRAPALVRVLIVIDPEDPRPAAPAAGKSPDGGA